MRIEIQDTPEGRALIHDILGGYFAFQPNSDGVPVATIEQKSGMLIATANEGEYPQREIDALYARCREVLPDDLWEPKYPDTPSRHPGGSDGAW